jgi:hypothetical protein
MTPYERSIPTSPNLDKAALSGGLRLQSRFAALRLRLASGG